MKQLFIISAIIISIATYSCGNRNTAANADNTSNKDEVKSSQSSAEQDLLDTTKLKSDLNDVISSVVSGNPDTTKLKNAAADILTTDAAMLSDSGIDKMYGNSIDPSVIAAKNSLKKMRDGMGITPDKLDIIRNAAAELQKGSH